MMVHNLKKSTKNDATPPDGSSIGPGVLEDAFIARKENEDDAILRANGHEAVMPRQFNWLSALGLGFSITNSWIGYLVSHHKSRKRTLLTSHRAALARDFNMEDLRPVFSAYWSLSSHSLSWPLDWGSWLPLIRYELAYNPQLTFLLTAEQSSGGQYHFCYILSPANTRRYSAYIVGWISMLAWWIVTYQGFSPLYLLDAH